jgi:hypothetical protein
MSEWQVMEKEAKPLEDRFQGGRLSPYSKLTAIWPMEWPSGIAGIQRKEATMFVLSGNIPV